MRIPPFQCPNSNVAFFVAIAIAKGSLGVTTVACIVDARRSTISAVGTSFMRAELRFRVGALNSMCISIGVGKYSLLYIIRVDLFAASAMRSNNAATRPAPGAPILEAVSHSSARVRFAAVPGDANVMVYIHVHTGPDGITRFVVDGGSGRLVPFGQRARAFACADTNSVIVVGLSLESTYTATIRSREQDVVDWGAESPHSFPLTLCTASPIPGAPVVDARGSDAIRIRWAVPFGTKAAALFIWHDRELYVIDHKTEKLMKLGAPHSTGWPVSSTECVARGLAVGKYECMIACYNGGLWSRCSPHSASVTIATCTDMHTTPH